MDVTNCIIQSHIAHKTYLEAIAPNGYITSIIKKFFLKKYEIKNGETLS